MKTVRSESLETYGDLTTAQSDLIISNVAIETLVGKLMESERLSKTLKLAALWTGIISGAIAGLIGFSIGVVAAQ